MNPPAPTARRVEWGPVVLAGIGVAVLLLGVRGYYLREHFGLVDALSCGLLLIPAGVLLLLTSYVFQHAKLVVLMPLFVTGLLVRDYPSFAVALGLALLATVVGPALREWRDARQQRVSTSDPDR